MASKGEQTRSTIVDTATRLFYTQGYEVTSYQGVAEACRLKKGNIQYHFNSKTDLLTAVIERRVGDVRALLESWSMECGTPYDCIERFIRMIEENAEDLAHYGCPMGTLSGELGKNDPQLQRQARAMFDLFLRWLEARFRALMPADRAQEHARHLMALAQGASVLAHVYGDSGIVHSQAAMMRSWLAEATRGPRGK